MSETVFRFSDVCALSLGPTPKGICVVMRIVDGSQRAEALLDPESAEAIGRALLEQAAAAQEAMQAALKESRALIKERFT